MMQRSFADCSDQHRIVHLGVARTLAPFEIVRTALGGSYFLACFGGLGEVLVNGRWESCGAGQAFLLSPGTLHAFRTVASGVRLGANGHWEFCWVRYRDGHGQAPVAQASSPVLSPYPPLPFFHAVSGLYHACVPEHAQPAAMSQWVELVHGYVRDFAQPAGQDARLERLWAAVERDLTSKWSTRSMARLAHVSEKQLERLCKRDLGRTPRQHLIALRMHRAAELLATSEDTVESIAAAVGYQNPFTFSNRFRRFSGWPPSRYPARRGGRQG